MNPTGPERCWQEYDPGFEIPTDECGIPLSLFLRDPNDYYQIDMRWDGCCNLSVAVNAPFAAFDKNHKPKEGSPRGAWIDGLHICDLRKFIERLQEALEEACDHFGDDGEWKGQRTQ